MYLRRMDLIARDGVAILYNLARSSSKIAEGVYAFISADPTDYESFLKSVEEKYSELKRAVFGLTPATEIKEPYIGRLIDMEKEKSYMGVIFPIYSQEAVEKEIFLANTDNLLGIKAILKDDLLYTDFFEPGKKLGFVGSPLEKLRTL